MDLTRALAACSALAVGLVKIHTLRLLKTVSDLFVEEDSPVKEILVNQFLRQYKLVDKKDHVQVIKDQLIFKNDYIQANYYRKSLKYLGPTTSDYAGPLTLRSSTTFSPLQTSKVVFNSK